MTTTTRDRIIDEFASWIASCGVGSNAIVDALDSVEFDALFQIDRGAIDDAEFAKWHEAAVSCMRRVRLDLSVGLAAKAINEYLKTKCYVGGYGREGLAERIHPPIDDGLIRGLRKEFANNADMRESLDSLEPMKRIDAYAKYDSLIRTCRRAARLSGCSLMEVEIFWDRAYLKQTIPNIALGATHMDPFHTLNGVVLPMNRVNVDTDQIIPKQFLKRVERTGFGEFLFYNWRFDDDGSPNADFVLNKPGYENAEIIVAGRNFGSGSSREHAPWALGQYGIKVVIAPSFADIFHNNCFQNGLLPIVLPEETVQRIIENAENDPGYKLRVDLEAERVWDDDERVVAEFSVEPFRRYCLLNGLDDIGLTLANEDDISAFESNRSSRGGVLTF